MEAVINSKGILLFAFLVVLSCGKTEEIGNKLTPEEIANLRARAASKCLSDTNEEYADFIADSNEAMLGYDRNGQEWDFNFKKNGTATETNKIHVWRVTNTAVYFRIALSTSPVEHVYIKYTKGANQGIMKSVQQLGCSQGLYKASVSSSTVTLNNDDKNFSQESSTVQYKVFRNFSFSSSQPALFGLLKYTLKTQKYDNDEKPTSSTTDSYEIVVDTTPTNQPSTVYNDPDFYGNTPSVRHYCLVVWDPAAGTTYQKYPIQPIDFTPISSATINCSTGNDTNDVTIGTEVFNPEVDLAIAN